MEIGTSVVRRTLQELTRELENYRFLLVEKEQQAVVPFFKELTATETKQAEKFLTSKNLLKRTNELIGKSNEIIKDPSFIGTKADCDLFGYLGLLSFKF